ncbi:M23 family metallopeptidase [Hyphococcus flavus]|uniref:M23 family metallopeptidase n=1 Tax=Hyphococcus flavus TaxID=1866326 RepID=A0AAF0CE40_9PROT|nr:M23 family metallopeptidase [Hyphococcus flavus]WDI30641.1 M23 family metallopeptidase [Hyphococcus flavus]
MKSVRLALLTSSFAAVAACGSHNHAPVVYGSDPSSQTRIYNSPNDIYREQRVAQRTRAPEYREPVYQPPQRRVTARSSQPAQLTPVSAVYLDEPQPLEEGSAAPSEHLHKAEGYIEVQPGDTVYALARKFSVSPASIIDRNDLKAPYALQVGQVLRLPSGSTVVASDTPTRARTRADYGSAAVAARQVAAQDQLYTVTSGDTLYSISRRADVPVDRIASANRMRAPYSLNVGQQLLIPQARAGSMQVAQRNQPKALKQEQMQTRDVDEIARSVSYTPPAAQPAKSMFDWPIRGAIVSEYGSGNLGRRNDGVNIAAPVGTPVRAAADGQVVYRGSELEGFGNLLLIKHEDGFVTAYAHNDTMIVKKGDQVRKGQVIAKVGATGAVTTPQLHFEIRQELKTVDPVALLGNP